LYKIISLFFSSSCTAIAALGCRQEVEQIKANVFYQHFYFCHVFYIFNVFIIFSGMFFTSMLPTVYMYMITKISPFLWKIKVVPMAQAIVHL